MDALDFVLAPIYTLLFYFLAKRVIKKNEHNPLYNAYYMRGLFYRLGGSAFFAFIYVYYYGGGDTLSFFYTCEPLFRLFRSDPAAFFGFVLSPYSEYPLDCYYQAASKGAAYLASSSTALATIRISALLNLFCFNSYLVLCLLIAYIGYRFQWMVYTLLCSLYPQLSKQLAYAFLMIPSVLFWGSAVGKDSIMLASIMLLFYSFYQMVIRKKNIIGNMFAFLIAGYLISFIRGFILFAVTPCLILMAVTYYRNAIQSSFLRFIIGPVFLIGGLGASFIFVRSLGETVESYNINSLQKKAEGFQSWHTYLGETQGGSAYSLGENLDYSALSIFRIAPVAIAISLFGPFVWQIRNAVMLMAGVESLIFLYFFARTFLNGRIYKLFGLLSRDHIVVFCAPFVIIIALAVGVTSFNYGALVRYRIPILPFFATLLIIINYHLNKPPDRIVAQ